MPCQLKMKFILLNELWGLLVTPAVAPLTLMPAPAVAVPDPAPRIWKSRKWTGPSDVTLKPFCVLVPNLTIVIPRPAPKIVIGPSTGISELIKHVPEGRDKLEFSAAFTAAVIA